HADVVGRGDHRHGGEHGAGAGNEDEPEAESEQETAAEVATRPPTESPQWPLDDLADTRDDEHRRQDEEQRDRDVAEEVLRQSEPIEQPGSGEKEERAEE